MTCPTIARRPLAKNVEVGLAPRSVCNKKCSVFPHNADVEYLTSITQMSAYSLAARVVGVSSLLLFA